MEFISQKTKNRKRVGRGISSGQGKTAGRGYKGQKSRSGYNLPNRFEGGQTPLSMRLPKLPGFKSFSKKAITLTLTQISKLFKDGETVSLEALKAKKVIKSGQAVKIVNTGKLVSNIKLSLDVKASKSVLDIIENMAKPEAKVEKKEVKAVEKTESKTIAKKASVKKTK